MNNKFLADVRSMSNYYPYGMEIKAGSWSAAEIIAKYGVK